MMVKEKVGIQEMESSIFKELINFQLSNPNIYIGGSVSLILQNYIPYRVPKDVDIISKERIHIYDIFKTDKLKKNRIKTYKHNNIIYDLFYNPNAEFIEYETEFGLLKISPIEEILNWKRKWILKDPNNKKHTNDLNE